MEFLESQLSGYGEGGVGFEKTLVVHMEFLESQLLDMMRTLVVHMEFLELQLSNTFKLMKQEGLVNDHFTFVYSLKRNIEDHFYVEIIAEFCSVIQDGLKLLTQIMNTGSLNYNLMKEYVYKVKGSSLSFGACRLAEAFADIERAIDADSKEGCLEALKRAQRQFSALEEKLHGCLQLERRLVILATEGTNDK
ncbi:hypothetical protein VNO78_10628 [Psophocarpus tetragonolobus]|uniref:Histidine-containing phosphotransfer protein n=1 Tax=Psophocarpus tetragonolobus TaxID=3891 RepID=A0AAN9XMP6_PSOTE